MTDHVRELSSLNPSDRKFVGAKAANLGRLMRAGWPTPGGFCITTAAYRGFLERNRLVGLVELSNFVDKREEEIAVRCRQVQEAMYSAVIPEAVTVSVERAREQLMSREKCPQIAVAVRSSATVEDRGYGSFAGMYDTYLNVPTKDLLTQVKMCWASLWSPAALIWLMGRKIKVADYSMAVVVQKMVQADSSGVMFTANPVSGNRFQVVIDSAPGLGEGVVSGSAECDRFVVSEYDLEIVESEISYRRDDPASLTKTQVLRLANTGLELQKQFGEPQDIEWAIVGERMYVLQCRPIVRLPPYFPIEQGSPYGIRKWNLEFPELFSYFGRSLERLKSPVYHQARSKALGVKYCDYQSTFNGYIYHYRRIRESACVPRGLSKLWPYLRLLMLSRDADRKFENELIPSFLKHSATIRSAVASTNSLFKLVDGIKAAVDCYLWLEAKTVLVNILGMTFCSLVLKASKYMGKNYNPLGTGHLLSGVPNKTSERDAMLADMVTLFHENRLSELVGDVSTWQEAVDRLRKSESGRVFLAELERFGDEFGYVWADGNVKDPGWRQDDGLIISFFRKRLEAGGGWEEERDVRPDEGAVAAPWYSFRRIILRKLVQQARRYSPYREDHNHYLSKAVMLIREALVACGDELVRRDIMTEPEGIFRLTYDEVMQLAQWIHEGRVEELKNLIRERALEVDRQRRLTPPSVIDFDQDEPVRPVSAGSILLSGTPASAGFVSGPARVLLRRDLEKVQEGEVLVCHNFRPDWSPVFRYIAALVANQGYSLSHGANLAREWGIPAVMGAHQATQIIRDGDILEVDGSKGIVRVEKINNQQRCHKERPDRHCAG